MATPRRSSTRGGFTLLETVVAMLIGSIVMTAVTTFFTFQLASMRKQRARRAAQMTARTTLNFITRQVEHVGRDPQRVLFASADNTTLPPAIITAGAHSIHYQTNLSASLTDQDATDPFEDVTLAVGNGVIWFTQGNGTPAALSDGTTLNSHVASNGLTFSYFDVAGTAVANPTTATARASVRRIDVRVTVIGGALAAETAGAPRVTLTQNVFLRNLF